jgi:hypothetical protein
MPAPKKTTAKKTTTTTKKPVQKKERTNAVIQKNGVLEINGKMKFCPHLSTIVSHPSSAGNIVIQTYCNIHCRLLEITANPDGTREIELCTGKKIHIDDLFDLRETKEGIA